jgi:NAD(P)-dependent dehydrogenase (short-subunit alcohol dehydrogenase family)
LLLSGKKALITGAAGSLGEAMSVRFAEEGCDVIVVDMNQHHVDALADRLKQQGYAARSFALDVTDEQAVSALFDEVDRLDVLVNNVGVTRYGFVQDMTLQEWNFTLNANLTSVFLCSKYAFPLLQQSASPAIINMSSINAFSMNPGLPVYAATKNAIIALTKQLAIEGAAHRIRANCISPGKTVSEAEQKEQEGNPDHDIDRDCYPFGRFGYPVEVANAAVFLASDLASFVNGNNLVVDGGMSLQAVSGVVRPDLRERWKPGVYRLLYEE